MTLVNMKSYIPELVSYFNEEMHQGNGFNVLPRVRFELYVEDIQLDVSQSVAIGLILNEVVTNSVKHAFEGRETGLISIRMTEEGENIHLTVADNGRGLVNASGIDKNKSMGFQLISRLTGQLKALLTVENRDGLITTIKFRKELRPDQVSMQG
jgi:two-component sensor histidine kinase